MIRELHDVLRSKTFTNYYCSPLYAFQCNKSRLKARGNSLLEYLLKTNRYRLDQGFNSTGNSGGRFKDVISQVEYKEIQINGENTSSQGIDL
jgi:hypothetical protein